MNCFARRFALLCGFLFASFTQSIGAPGESAVITLVFPPGARATGMGETFVGIADDVNATFFNPAGLGQSPLSNTWKTYYDNDTYRFTSITAKKKKPFDIHEQIWVGTNKGILLFNGKVWKSWETHLLEEGEELEAIIERYLDTDDDEAISAAALSLMRENGIEMKRYNAIDELLGTHLTADSLKRSLHTLIYSLFSASRYEISTPKIYAQLSSVFDTTAADTLSDKIADILAWEDIELESLVELKIPFTMAIKDSVTALFMDASEQLWVGTEKGLWRYDGSSWVRYTVGDGLPSNSIRGITEGDFGMIAIATDRGVGLFADGLWKRFTEADGLPSSSVRAVCFGKENTLIAGTPAGLAWYRDSTWEVLDTSDGLLTDSITALHYDSQNRLWIGGPNGVTIYNELAWKRYRFPNSTVLVIQEYQPGKVWIGTNRGAIAYKAGKVRTDDAGNRVEQPPEWKAYHSKNALTGNVVRDIAIHGRDLWLVTDEAVNRYDRAERQLMSFWEPLLPAFGIRDLWHLYLAGLFPSEDWGTIGFFINYINMGTNTMTDEFGRETQSFRSYEIIFALSYGLGIREDFSLGLNAKYIHSALAPGIGSGSEGIGRSFAIDAALLKRNFLLDNLDLGFHIQNMGPSIFYVSKDRSDPIPFTLKLGLAYRALQTPIHDLKFGLDLNREIVKNYAEKNPDPFWQAFKTDLLDRNEGEDRWDNIKQEVQEILVHLGTEYWYVNFLALRLGFLFDYIGERYELTFGLGLKYGNMNVDWSYIHSPEGFMKGFLQSLNDEKTGATGARHGQWRLSLITRF